MTSSGKELGCVSLYFGTPEAPSLTTVPIVSASFSVTSICKTLAPGEISDVRLPAADAYFLMLYLEDADHADIREDGSCKPVRHYARGTVCLVDLEDGAAIRLHSPLRSLAFVLPKALFEEAASLPPGTRTSRLACRRGWPDDVLANLGTALLALLGGGSGGPPALLRHMAVAICAHLLHQYGEIRGGGSDAPQTGSAGTRRMRGRVEQAMEAMAGHVHSLEAVARASGFDDLDHFDRVFLTETGMTPADWRRRRLN